MLKPYRRLFPYFARYRAKYAIGATCVVISVALKLLVPLLLGDSLDALRTGDQQTLGALILTASLLMVGAATLAATIRTFSRWLILGNSRRAVHDLRRDLFAHLLKLAPSFYVRHPTGHLMSRCVNDMQNVQGLMGPVFMYLVETFVLYVVGLAFLLSKSWSLTLWVMLPFPFFLVAARRLATRIQLKTRQGQERLAELGAKVDESLSGQKVIKSLALEDHDHEQFKARAVAYRDTMLEVARIRATLQPAMMFLSLLGTFLLLGLGVPMVVRGELGLGAMIAMVFWLQALAAPTATLGFVVSSLRRGAAALQRVGEIIDMPVTVADPTNPTPNAIGRGGLEVRDLSIEFAALHQLPHLTNLPDGAPGRPGQPGQPGRRVLDGVSFSIGPGQTIGVVGATGAGKTTLLRALSRQLEVDRGQVFIDGTDVNDIRISEHRGAVGVVPQEPFLFSMSLACNIAFGSPTADRQQIECAAATAQLSSDLRQFPAGLDTLVGERGVNLSGGQRQRTALARVLVLQPKILLLDDTLSAVDTGTSERILEQLRPLMANCTTVLVAHRIATLVHADQIIVLHAGRIAERGTHAQLLACDGIYASLHRRQSHRSRLQQELGLGDELDTGPQPGELS